MGYFSMRTIKSTRKPHHCCACAKPIGVGEPAFYWAGDCDGDFCHVYYHSDCRAAEEKWNDNSDTWGDEYMSLECIAEEPDDVLWLIDEFPAVAARMGLTKGSQP